MSKVLRLSLIELRRFFSILLLPWVAVVLFCIVGSWYTLFVLGLDALLAPILKLWLILKPLLFKTLPALLFWFWVHTGAKLIGWIGELVALVITLFGGWKAWSLKKMARQGVRFVLSLSARFVAVSVLTNLLFGHERRGVKSLPRLALHQLNASWFGHVLRWWTGGSERQKRLVLGILLCLTLVLAGQAMLGISVLLFDLVWELLLLVWRMLMILWRLISPLLVRLIPNFIGNFFTNKLIPLIAEVIPLIKDDHRVIYLRFNIRRNIRRTKAWLYLKSRARRVSVRKHLTSIVSDELRVKKAQLLDAATKLKSKTKD